LARWNWKFTRVSGLIGSQMPRAPPIASQLIATVWTISPMPIVAIAK
jgi:hypothetical protein